MINRRTAIGTVVILWGISILFPFPIGRIIFGLVFCYLGYTIIIGKKSNLFSKKVNCKDNMFNASDIKCEHSGDYNVIFGSSDIVIDNDSQNCTINIVFSSADINILTERPIEIKAESVFASVNLPNGNHISFGDNVYKADGIGEPLKIKISTVFGSTDIRKI